MKPIYDSSKKLVPNTAPYFGADIEMWFDSPDQAKVYRVLYIPCAGTRSNGSEVQAYEGLFLSNESLTIEEECIHIDPSHDVTITNALVDVYEDDLKKVYLFDNYYEALRWVTREDEETCTRSE